MWCEFESVLPASHTCHTAFPPPPCPSWLSFSQANLQPPRLNPAPSHARSFPGIYRVVPKVARGLFCPAAPRSLEHLWEAYEPLSWNRGVLAVCRSHRGPGVPVGASLQFEQPNCGCHESGPTSPAAAEPRPHGGQVWTGRDKLHSTQSVDALPPRGAPEPAV